MNRDEKEDEVKEVFSFFVHMSGHRDRRAVWWKTIIYGSRGEQVKFICQCFKYSIYHLDGKYCKNHQYLFSPFESYEKCV